MEVAQQYGDQVRFIGVPGLGDVADFEDFIADTGSSSLDQIPDVDGAIWAQFDVTQHRTYIFIDDDGTVERVSYGSLETDVLDLIAR